jgi:hypothetical protein
MNFQQFRLAYNSFLWALRFSIILALILWAKNSLHYFQETKLIDLILNIDSLEKNFPKVWDIVKFWLIETGWLLVKLAIMKFIMTIVRKFPIQSKWLVHWDNLGEICPVLGREIASHLRHNQSINFMTLIELYSYSKHQMILLKFHNQDEYVQQIFKKYDAHYESDINESTK